MGERSILIEFEPKISEIYLEKILFYKNILEKFYLKEKVEVINTYSSLLINYVSHIENIYDEISGVKQAISGTNIVKKLNSKLYHIPVCYDPEFGLDLRYVSEQKKLSHNQIIDLHFAPVYTVYFTGFLPGFLYLGGLDPKLKISRRETPRMSVLKGAVGIGENQTGIYPKSSPGGWQIIGNSPVNFFDKTHEPPCEILAGDKVKFFSISKREYEVVFNEVQSGKFHLKSEKYEG
ncbi:5-oxoprolinase subunit PxpB [Antarcticibacterium arcticum]|uniref:5-oxoprolinase subunit PxpB n=2 Tax=Antarcticibacterium arcticum TaxID=2585771 RepID=A0A5B8YQP0_9FLAO|nr:5-oxoprolinase subunit PxpB [Antarcticibacterium arcticum]